MSPPQRNDSNSKRPQKKAAPTRSTAWLPPSPPVPLPQPLPVDTRKTPPSSPFFGCLGTVPYPHHSYRKALSYIQTLSLSAFGQFTAVYRVAFCSRVSSIAGKHLTSLARHLSRPIRASSAFGVEFLLRPFRQTKPLPHHFFLQVLCTACAAGRGTCVPYMPLFFFCRPLRDSCRARQKSTTLPAPGGPLNLFWRPPKVTSR